MGVTCSKCGEELLGAVNRCWRCGTQFVPQPGDAGLPPVRQPPPESLDLAAAADEPVTAEVVGTAGSTSGVGDQAALESAPDLAELDHDSETAAPQIDNRASSVTETPKADNSEPGSLQQGDSTAAPPRGRFSLPRAGTRYGILLGCVSLAIGAVSVYLSFRSGWALPLSLIGLLAGVWGLCGARGGLAMVGVLLCCAAFALSGYRGLITTYTWYTGHSPFDHSPVDETFDETDPDGAGWEEGWPDEPS